MCCPKLLRKSNFVFSVFWFVKKKIPKYLLFYLFFRTIYLDPANVSHPTLYFFLFSFLFFIFFNRPRNCLFLPCTFFFNHLFCENLECVLVCFSGLGLTVSFFAFVTKKNKSLPIFLQHFAAFIFTHLVRVCFSCSTIFFF